MIDYTNHLLNAHLNNKKSLNTSSSPCFVEEMQRLVRLTQKLQMLQNTHGQMLRNMHGH